VSSNQKDKQALRLKRAISSTKCLRKFSDLIIIQWWFSLYATIFDIYTETILVGKLNLPIVVEVNLILIRKVNN